MSEARTEEATPRQERRARERGRAWQSRDLVLGAVLAATGGVLSLGASSVRGALTGVFEELFADVAASDPVSPGEVLRQSVWMGTSLLVPLLATLVVLGALVSAVQVGGLFAPAAIAPDASRLDPSGRFGAGAGARIGSTLLFGALRLALVLAVVVLTLAQAMPGIATLSRQAPGAALDAVIHVGGTLTLRSGIALLALGVLDAIVERALFRASLKMTRRERDRDRRDAEGDLHLRRERDRIRDELHREGELDDVRGAALVVTDDEGLVVALAYDAADPDAVPRVLVVARADRGAEVLREARTSDVPCVADADLVAQLAIVPIGGPIPEALYEPVARAMPVRA